MKGTNSTTTGSREGTAASANKPGTSASSNRRSTTSVGFRLEDLIPNYISHVRHLFAFSFIWGFGGNLHDRCAIDGLVMACGVNWLFTSQVHFVHLVNVFIFH